MFSYRWNNSRIFTLYLPFIVSNVSFCSVLKFILLCRLLLCFAYRIFYRLVQDVLVTNFFIINYYKYNAYIINSKKRSGENLVLPIYILKTEGREIMERTKKKFFPAARMTFFLSPGGPETKIFLGLALDCERSEQENF